MSSAELILSHGKCAELGLQSAIHSPVNVASSCVLKIQPPPPSGQYVLPKVILQDILG